MNNIYIKSLPIKKQIVDQVQWRVIEKIDFYTEAPIRMMLFPRMRDFQDYFLEDRTMSFITTNKIFMRHFHDTLNLQFNSAEKGTNNDTN